jgi:hypothetical protein
MRAEEGAGKASERHSYAQRTSPEDPVVRSYGMRPFERFRKVKRLDENKCVCGVWVRADAEPELNAVQRKSEQGKARGG